ncbi:hypothetical protein HELRODRAFT_195024 [Helobdella robusta]|uniref:Uncharacterized protein n=1 Tax=Helobdella robusta TaxID=6412 RepID=T1FWN7_HELRO|nr:hypothetical protein HELRODRAFT_195024 [Helobdella robusta]ESO09751.1 hypothetical protein HELRODRAFT_195024 [Helobdella robusta]
MAMECEQVPMEEQVADSVENSFENARNEMVSMHTELLNLQKSLSESWECIQKLRLDLVLDLSSPDLLLANLKISKITASLRSNITNTSELSKIQNEYSQTFSKLLVGLSEEEKASIDDLVLSCIDIADDGIISAFAIPVLAKKRFLEWKKKDKFIDEMINKVHSKCMNSKVGDKIRLDIFTEKLMSMLDDYQLADRHADSLIKLVQLSFGEDGAGPENWPVQSVGLNVVNKFPWTSRPEHVVETMGNVINSVKKYGSANNGTTLATNIQLFILHAFYLDRQSIQTHLKVLDEVTKMFNRCADEDWDCVEEPGKTNIFRVFVLYVMEYFIQAGCQTKAELLKPMYKKVASLRDCGDKEIMALASKLMSDVADVLMEEENVTDMLELYLDGKMDGLGHKLKDMYLNDATPFFPLLSRFSYLLQSAANDSISSTLILFFTEVAKSNPEKLPDDLCDNVVKFLTHQWYYSLALMLLDTVAVTCRRDDVIKHEEKILQCGVKVENAAALVANMLPKLAVDEEKSEKYLQYMSDRCRANMNSLYVGSFVNSMRMIGSTHPHLFAKHKDLLLDIMKHNATHKDLCQAAVNVIEGKSLETVFENINETKSTVKEISENVKQTEKNVKKLETRTSENEKSVKNIKSRVQQNETNIKELKTTVVETKVKVEEIDHKTLSHAPTWSRDVSKLMNQAGDKDWRLFCRRLGYSNDDVKKFATQSDPCMSLLDDWFACHTTREATHAVMRELKEMGRMDAYAVVERVVLNAEEVAGKDEDEEEASVQPVVFLSYQWDKQDEVKLLKRHLEMSGYPCWMDVGQMGGGDKLFQKIDQGMRKVKVVVCCITQKYAESPNCNREVNLALNLNKTMIPLLMDKMEWPPRGGMGPIFGEFLFIRFYKRDKDEIMDGTYWPSSMFTQLLFQIRYQVAPLESLITEDSSYKQWWVPKDQTMKNGGKKSNSNLSANHIEESKQIFISYQWDKQSEVKKLYNALTSHGYHCWLDIMMMGGGVSLYDMIDKGIRGAQLVLSCVTKKYALSANCRREVALSDAIKKPIIPLLFEKEAWPAEGPMGMILTPLQYLNFNQSQNAWDDNFEELIKRIHQIIPPSNNQPIKSAVTAPPTNDVHNNKPSTAAKPTSVNKMIVPRKSSTNQKPAEPQNKLPNEAANSGTALITNAKNAKSPPVPTKPAKIKSEFQFKQPKLTSSINTSPPPSLLPSSSSTSSTAFKHKK